MSSGGQTTEESGRFSSSTGSGFRNALTRPHQVERDGTGVKSLKKILSAASA